MNLSNVSKYSKDQKTKETISDQGAFSLDKMSSNLEHLFTLNGKDIGLSIDVEDDSGRENLNLIQMNINGDEDFIATLATAELSSDITTLSYRSLDSSVVLSVACKNPES